MDCLPRIELPKQAVNTISVWPFSAKFMLAMRMPELLPHVNTDNARIESLSSEISPKADEIATSSCAHARIIEIEPMNVPKIENNWKNWFVDKWTNCGDSLSPSDTKDFDPFSMWKKLAPPEWQRSQGHTTQIQRCRFSLAQLNKKKRVHRRCYTLSTQPRTVMQKR